MSKPLTGQALNKNVAIALGGTFEMAKKPNLSFVVVDGKRYGWGNNQACGAWAPSTDWAQGGPLIEREKITLSDCEGGWAAGYAGTLNSFGPTPLIAAMRCFVASKEMK